MTNEFEEYQEFLRFKRAREAAGGEVPSDEGSPAAPTAAELVGLWTEVSAELLGAMGKVNGLRQQADKVAKELSRRFGISVGVQPTAVFSGEPPGPRYVGTPERAVPPVRQAPVAEDDEAAGYDGAPLTTEEGNDPLRVQRARGDLPGELLPDQVPDIPEEFADRIKLQPTVAVKVGGKKKAGKAGDASFQKDIVSAFDSVAKFLR